MYETMNESPIKSKIKISEKSDRKFLGLLRRLAKLDSWLINKMKVAVYKEDIIEDKKKIIIAPSMFMDYHSNLNNHNSNINTNVNIIENIVTEKETLSPIDTELIDHPNSSDFDDNQDK